MPIIQLSGGNNAATGAADFLTNLDAQTRELQQSALRQRERRQAFEQQVQLAQFEQAQAFLREEGRREDGMRRERIAQLQEDGRNRRAFLDRSSRLGLPATVSGQNLMLMGAQLEELDPQLYESEFLPRLRELTGVDFGDGEGQVIPNAELLEQLPQAAQIFGLLGEYLVPARAVADERATQDEFTMAVDSVNSISPEWLQDVDGQEWLREYAGSMAISDLPPDLARRRTRAALQAAKNRIHLYQSRRLYLRKAQELYERDGLSEKTRADMSNLQLKIMEAKKPRLEYLRMLRLADPDANAVAQMTHEESFIEGQAAHARRGLGEEAPASPPNAARQQENAVAESMGLLREAIAPVESFDATTRPELAEALGVPEDEAIVEAREIAASKGLNLDSEDEAREVARELARREMIRARNARREGTRALGGPN